MVELRGVKAESVVESEKTEEIPIVFIQPKDCVLTVKWDFNYEKSTPEKE